jgi:tripartite-type tricarboxylate transporter receptor subunit TctC
MKLLRRQFVQLAAAAFALPVLPRAASALDYPTKPVRMIVPFAPAGPTDILARLMGQWLSERLGQSFIIENRPGANSNVGTEAAVNAPADGYTLLLVGAAGAINASVYQKLNFSLVRDILPVAGIGRVPLVMEVHPSVPAKTVPEFIAFAKANPGTVSMASAGVGNPTHIAGELFKMMTGVDMVHVPYRGSGPALTDMLGGQVQVMFDAMPSSIEYLRAGKLRALAVTTAAQSDTLPNVPTVSESVAGYEASSWYGIGVPKTTAPEIIEKLNKEINAAFADPKVQGRLADLGAMALPGSAADFGKFIAVEIEKWGKVVKFAGVKPD